MPSSAARLLQRHVIPAFVVSLYYSLRYRCLVSPQARIQFSPHITFGRGTVVKPFVIIQTHEGKIAFGNHCAISSFNHISTGNGDLIVGNNVRIAPSVTIVASSRKFQDKSVPIVDQGHVSQGIQIGDDVLIGAGVTILDGCHIGEGAVIGAGSVVTKEIPAYSIVAGVPATVIGHRQ